MKKIKKMKWSFRYIIPGIIAVILLSAVFLSNKYITKQSLGSIYNIDEAEDNFYNIQIGDSINYEVNGYSDWQVIGKDEYTGTIDVVSKTNTEDLTLEPNLTKQDYERIFQETANKYMDNNYAISARTVNSNDLEYFNYDNNFWLNNITDTNITTSQSTWQYAGVKNHKMYVIPYIEKYFENYNEYNVGDTIEYSNNGVNRWVVAEVREWDSILILIPETPIELVIESIDDNISEKANQIIQSFNNDVYNYGNYVGDFGNNNLTTLIPNFLNQQTERIWLLNYYQSYMFEKDSYGMGMLKYMCRGPSITYYIPGSGIRASCDVVIYNEAGPKTLGYRPIVTLKVKSEVQDKDKKEISSKLQVGDNVKYEAKGYKNWKVLSIDKDNNTVDIISGGIVKNITLSGKEDWDNYEDIIQREVDEYKIGSQAKKATTVSSSHLKTLKEIDKSTLSRYWILSKNTFVNKSFTYDNKNADLIYYNIGIINLYKNDNFDKYVSNIAIYADFKGNQGTVEHYNNDGYYTNEINQSSYTAGLRPVITLKLDSVEKLSEEDAKRIEESTEKQEKIFIKEQESKNKNYKGPSKVDDSTSSTGNNEVKTNDNGNTKDNITDNSTSNVEKIVYKDKPFYKYGFIIFLITSIIELIIILLLLRKIKR